MASNVMSNTKMPFPIKRGPATARTASDRIGRFSRSQPSRVVVDRVNRGQDVANTTSLTDELAGCSHEGAPGSVVDPTVKPPHCYTPSAAELLSRGRAGDTGPDTFGFFCGRVFILRGLFSSRCERDHIAVAVPPFISRSVDHLEMRLTSSLPQPAQNRRNPMPRTGDFKRLNLSHSEQAMIKKWSRVMVAIYASFAVIRFGQLF
jgi:hypothetical protein